MDCKLLKHHIIQENLLIQQESIPVGFVCTTRFSSSRWVGRVVCPAPKAGHMTCDACWDTTPPSPAVDRQTPVKTLTCPKLRLRAVNNKFCHFIVKDFSCVKIVHRVILFQLFRRQMDFVNPPDPPVQSDSPHFCAIGHDITNLRLWKEFAEHVLSRFNLSNLTLPFHVSHCFLCKVQEGPLQMDLDTTLWYFAQVAKCLTEIKVFCWNIHLD